MSQVNRYFRFSKISEAKFRQILHCFALDLTASQTAELVRISRRSINAIYGRIRKTIAQECETQSPFKGIIEADEAYVTCSR